MSQCSRLRFSRGTKILIRRKWPKWVREWSPGLENPPKWIAQAFPSLWDRFRGKESDKLCLERWCAGLFDTPSFVWFEWTFGLFLCVSGRSAPVVEAIKVTLRPEILTDG